VLIALPGPDRDVAVGVDEAGNEHGVRQVDHLLGLAFQGIPRPGGQDALAVQQEAVPGGEPPAGPVDDALGTNQGLHGTISLRKVPGAVRSTGKVCVKLGSGSGEMVSFLHEDAE